MMIFAQVRTKLFAIPFAFIAAAAFAQNGPPQPNNVKPIAPVALGTESMTWATGVAYVYDGAGNIQSIGSDSYVYDAVGRLVQSELAGARTAYEYDAFGNRTKCLRNATDCQFGIAADSTTAAQNRLASTLYDAVGNVTGFGGSTYFSYDALNMTTRDTSTAPAREYIYTADDERLAVDNVGSSWNWTVRDTSGRVLREFNSQDPSSGPVGSASWQWRKDYVWRGALLASRQVDPVSGAITTYHYHLDHLGTPRRITDDQNRIIGIHDYHAFGPEKNGGSDESALMEMKFTGHKRDLGAVNELLTLDYVHARYYNAALGRFLAVDPVIDGKAKTDPQRWNRYAYARNSPLVKIDPDGRAVHSGLAAGAVENRSGDETIWVAATIGPNDEVVVIPLKPGENSRAFVEDADAIMFEPGQTVSKERIAAWKVGPGDVTVDDLPIGWVSPRDKRLIIYKDGKYYAGAVGTIVANALPGSTHKVVPGVVTAAVARANGWQVPQTEEQVKQAWVTRERLRLRLREQLRKARKEHDEPE